MAAGGWLKRSWAVLGFDWSYHLNQAELAAIRQYRIGVFYLWGAEIPNLGAYVLFRQGL